VVPAGASAARRGAGRLPAGISDGGLALQVRHRPDAAGPDNPDLLAGTWSLLEDQLGAVRQRMVRDNDTGIGRGGRLAVAVAAFTGTLATWRAPE
jgi:hypothetical protein